MFWVFVGVRPGAFTHLSLVCWKSHSSNCPYHSPSITDFSPFQCLLTVIQTKVSFITLRNSDVRPDPELGSHPIQLEHINEKSCTTHPTSTEDTVLGISSVTFYHAWLAGKSNAVCVHLKQGWLEWLCCSLNNTSCCYTFDALRKEIEVVQLYTNTYKWYKQNGITFMQCFSSLLTLPA